jgi:predicted MPP superfamily phosphohydrolase
MRIAIISDVHSNLEAITEVVRAIEKLRVDRVVCLGDVVGYGASPNDCCALVKPLAEICLLGNHDAAVSRRMDYSFYYDAACNALDWTASVIDSEYYSWLRSLPYTYRIGDIGFSRLPIDPRAYEYMLLWSRRELIPHAEELPA